MSALIILGRGCSEMKKLPERRTTNAWCVRQACQWNKSMTYFFFPNEAALQLKSHFAFRFLKYVLLEKMIASSHPLPVEMPFGKILHEWQHFWGIYKWPSHAIPTWSQIYHLQHQGCSGLFSVVSFLIQLTGNLRRKYISPNLMSVSLGLSSFRSGPHTFSWDHLM